MTSTDIIRLAALRVKLRGEASLSIPEPHSRQQEFIENPLDRVIVRAGRRSGKTVGAAILALRAFRQGQRVLYATPTQEQVDAFWYEIKRALAPLRLYKNESLHLLEVPNTKVRLRAKTAWNADTLRGDYADLLILDEWQLMNEDAWGLVGSPMLLDNGGKAVFFYTPPSVRARATSRARDPLHAAKLFRKAQADPRWATFSFTSHDNPFLDRDALEEVSKDMTSLAYRQEIMAEDVEDVPGALWKWEDIDRARVLAPPELSRVVVGVDPPGGATECGIVVGGLGKDGHLYILQDCSLRASPDGWAGAVLDAYVRHKADRVVGERNYGGDMVEHTIRQKARDVAISYKNVNATRGKAVRAEPVAALYERGQAHHVGMLAALEEELVSWVPGVSRLSPNRLDSCVWTCTELMVGQQAMAGLHGEKKVSVWK